MRIKKIIVINKVYGLCHIQIFLYMKVCFEKIDEIYFVLHVK
jgi:hypothetical protein